MSPRLDQVGPLSVWVYEEFEDDDLFQRVRVDPAAGTIVWPNGADLSAHTLYVQSRPAATKQAK